MPPLHRLPSRGPRGFTLIEAMVSLAILAVGLLGIMQVQVAAARQNGVARRTAQAAALARDFAETVQRWPNTDPRLATTAACGAPFTNFPITATMLGNAKVANLKLDYTATAAGADATAQATTSDALTLNGTTYDGKAPKMLTVGGAVGGEALQLMWSVRPLDSNTKQSGCEAALINLVVRYPTGQDGRYRNLVTTIVKYNSNQLLQNGLAEAI